MDFRLLLFPQVSVIFRYSQLVSAYHIDDTCKILTSFYMCFLLFRLCFLCFKFKMNHYAFFIMTKITITVCYTVLYLRISPFSTLIYSNAIFPFAYLNSSKERCLGSCLRAGLNDSAALLISR